MLAKKVEKKDGKILREQFLEFKIPIKFETDEFKYIIQSFKTKVT